MSSLGIEEWDKMLCYNNVISSGLKKGDHQGRPYILASLIFSFSEFNALSLIV
jgi:hypothetical protein